jgi:pulcherriminic acid synthase
VTVSVADALRSDEYLRNPFPTWRRLREEHPLFYDEAADRWILSRFEDVVSVLGDHETYSTRTYQERFRPVFGRTLAELDGPRHIRERTIVAPAFVGRGLAGYRPFIESSVDLLGADYESGSDLVDVMTNRLPLTVISALLGFAPADNNFVFEVGNTILEALEDDPELRARGREAHRRLAGHLAPLVAARREGPTDDLISRIVHGEADGERLTDEEIFSFVSFLLVAGGPTTDMALRNFWWALLDHPEELERCREDPDRIQRGFSESLRRDGPIVYEDRRTNRPVEWYGRELPTDANVLMCLGSANNDDSIFADPERFDPDRQDLLMGTERKPGYHAGGVAGHLAFGLGSHFCMGYQLARVEAVVATERFLLSLNRPRLRERHVPVVNWFERTVPHLLVDSG